MTIKNNTKDMSVYRISVGWLRLLLLPPPLLLFLHLFSFLLLQLCA